MVTKVLGIARLRRKLKQLPEAMRVEIAAAMEQGAEEVVAMARHLVPVDDGALRDSIGWCWGVPPKDAKLITRSRPMWNKDGRDMTISIYAGNNEAFYARWVEFGTQRHSLAKGADISRRGKRQNQGPIHPGARMQPFFFPAFRATKKKVKSRISRSITKAAKKVAAGK